MKFLWTTIHVSNMEQSIEFYTEVVGLNVVRKFDSPTGKTICFLGEGETQVELIYGPNDVINMTKSVSVGFQVPSLDKKIEELASKGIEPYEGPVQPNPNIKFFYVLDPDGFKVQFAELM